ncbi:MAG: Gfo/Idh/MocA family oxidoreductase [Treponema sp.]|nr:Gfo/Idh/MocA family oxidoreductase [Treponema sp.]
MAKIKTGIVGCGRISAVYKNVFKELADMAAPAFAVDRDLSRAGEFASEFGASYSDKLEDMLDAKPDIVHICTPHFLHKEQVIACLEHGINVLCEKPIAINLADAQAMIDTAKNTGSKLGIIFQNRYIKGIVELKKAILEGRLGRLVNAVSTLNWHRPPSYYECDWKGSWEKEGGGVLIDQAIHSIDLVRYLAGSPVKSIDGRIGTKVLTKLEVEDWAQATVEFQNGVVYSLSANNYNDVNAPISIDITGENGSAHFDGETAVITTKDGTQIIAPEKAGMYGESYWDHTHFLQIKDCYRAHLNGEPYPVPPEEAKKTLAVVLGVYESSRQNKKIFLQED